MRNLTVETLRSDQVTVANKLSSLFQPNIYQAEDLFDFTDNRKELTCGWWQRSTPFRLRQAYILIYNVSIMVMNGQGRDEEADSPCWFKLQDHSDMLVVPWYHSLPVIASRLSFTQAQKEQGLKENDFVYEVTLGYYLDNDLPYIIDVQKDEDDKPKKYRKKKKEEKRWKKPGFDWLAPPQPMPQGI